MKTLFKKLAEAQKNFPKMTKDQKGYNYKYFDINQILEKVRPILEDNNLTLSQPLSTVEGRPSLKTILVDIESGEMLEDTIVMPDIADPQKMGSCVTYYRRYALQSMLGLEAEDDDGAKAKVTPEQYAERAIKAIKSAELTSTISSIQEGFNKVVDKRSNDNKALHAKVTDAAMKKSKELIDNGENPF